MSACVKSIVESGDQGILIDVECHLSNGLPNIIIVGFANKSVDEAKERVRSAFSNTKLDLPKKRITINLAPADVPKDGSSFDLAIATAILAAGKQLHSDKTDKSIFLGELGLDGTVKPVRGIIGKLLQARKKRYKTFFIPRANLNQALLVPGITVIPITNLRELYLHLSGSLPTKVHSTGAGTLPAQDADSTLSDFAEVTGQARAKRALEIAAAGTHNVLLNGPPGAGKSMLAKAMPSILPPMELEEILEATHLHSLANRQYDQIISTRPFRTPHHSASEISIVGGGQHPRPGEISLSHRGILFFDEFPEFSRSTIEALRQPLEDRFITVARARETVKYPANFILIATSNPCPCGYYGTSKSCSCMPHQIQKYQKKLSGPVLDRIDLHVDVDEVKHTTLLSESKEETSYDIQQRVLRARRKQLERYQNPLMNNANLGNKEIKSLIKFTPAAQELLNQAADRLNISARSYMKVVKVAQTIVDLENEERIDTRHVSEALQYRRQDHANSL